MAKKEINNKSSFRVAQIAGKYQIEKNFIDDCFGVVTSNWYILTKKVNWFTEKTVTFDTLEEAKKYIKDNLIETYTYI